MNKLSFERRRDRFKSVRRGSCWRGFRSRVSGRGRCGYVRGAFGGRGAGSSEGGFWFFGRSVFLVFFIAGVACLREGRWVRFLVVCCFGGRGRGEAFLAITIVIIMIVGIC